MPNQLDPPRHLGLPSTRQAILPQKELIMVKVKRGPSGAVAATSDQTLSREPSTSVGKQLVRIKIKSTPKVVVPFAEDDTQLSRESSKIGGATLPDYDSGGEKSKTSNAPESTTPKTVTTSLPHKELVMLKIKSAALVKSAQLVSLDEAREPSKTYIQAEPALSGHESKSAATPVSLPVSAAAAGPVLTLVKIKSAVRSKPKSMMFSPGLLREPSLIKSAPISSVAPSTLPEGETEIGREASIVAVKPLSETAGTTREPSVIKTKTEMDKISMSAKAVLKEQSKSLGK